jgi:4-amino-4-deoxy-L-arabinose transferase-like glycosyltransferase
MQNTFRDSKIFVYSLLLGIILLGTFLRLYHLDYQSIWGDEAVALTVSHAPVEKIVTYFKEDGSEPPLEWNPPLYHYALHSWFRIFGFGVFQARLMSAVVGILGLPLVFLIAKRLYGANAALLATLLTAVSQLGVRYSQEIRPYELAFLFFLATVHFFLIATDKHSLFAWSCCTIFAVLLVGTHYYAALGIVSLGLYSILFWKARSVPLTWIIGSAITGFAAVVPWLVLVFKGQLRAASRQQPPWFAVRWQTPFSTINNFNNGLVSGFERSAPLWTFVVGGLLFTVPVTMMVWRWLKKGRDTVSSSEKNSTALVFILWAVPVIIVLVFGRLLSNPFAIRYVAFGIAPYYILVAAGTLRLRSVALRWAIVIISLCYSGYALRANYFIPYKENYRDGIAYISERSRVDDCYAFVPWGSVPLEWPIYMPSSPTRLISPDHEMPSGPSCSRIWVLNMKRVEDLPPTWREVLGKVRSNFQKREEKEFFWMGVELYTAPAAEGP